MLPAKEKTMNKANQNKYILSNFDLEEIMEFMDDHDVEIIKGSQEGSYLCLVDYDGDGEPYATENHPLIALINGIRRYNTEVGN
jgi:hypothetical protein